MTARCDETTTPLCKLAFASAQIHQLSGDHGPVTDLLLRSMEVRSGAAKSACSPVLPVSDSASMKKACVLPQILQNPFLFRAALQEAESFLTTERLRQEDASPEMMSAERVTMFLSDRLSDFSPYLILVREMLFLRDLIMHLLIKIRNVYFCLNQHIKKTA